MTTDANDMILSPAEKQIVQPLQTFMEPERLEGVKEVVINKPGQVVYEKYDGTWEYIDAPELALDRLLQIMNLLADRTGQTFNVSNPILSCKFPGGHRVQIVAGQQNAQRFSMSIRVKQEREFALEDYKMEQADRDAIIEAVRNQKTLLISGGTGSGKTTFMNALLKFIPEEERLVTIEDVRELKIPHENVCIFLFSNFAKSGGMDRQSAVNELLNATLRMRPDRILLGEIRKENAFTFASAINTGHQGSMATVHANDPKSALDAVINRVLLNGDTSESAINILRKQLENDIYGVVQLNRVKDGVAAYFEVMQTENPA